MTRQIGIWAWMLVACSVPGEELLQPNEPGLPKTPGPSRRWSLQGSLSNANFPCLVREGDVYCANDGKVEGVEGAVFVQSGADFHCALDEKKQVWCWGYNGNGQLGRGTVARSAEFFPPMEVAPDVLGEVTTLAVGSFSACALNKEGQVWCWGRRLWVPRRNNPQPTRVPLMAPASHLAVGWQFGCAILEGGEVACWGNIGSENEANEEPSIVTLPERMRDIWAGSFHVCARGMQDTLHCWGDPGAIGILEGPDDVHSFELGAFEDFSAGYYMSCILADEPKCFGSNLYGSFGERMGEMEALRPQEAVTPPGFENAKAIAVGFVSVCALFEDERVECRGYTEELDIDSISPN